MKVPSSATAPTMTDTFQVGFWRWLTSSKADRVEWARRRNAAQRTARQEMEAVRDARYAEVRAADRAREAELKQQLSDVWQNRPKRGR